jgi:putative transposase
LQGDKVKGGMARPLRIEFAGAIYHVTARGNRRAKIYRDDLDKDGFLSIFGRVKERVGWQCHAYCLMDNHYHLLLETPQGRLSEGMRLLNGIYTQGYNRRHRKVGHLFQGRYKAILVEKEAYLLELARYVVLNPVRAGIVEEVAAWKYSSYRGTCGEEENPWIESDWLLRCFGANRKTACETYREFVHLGIGQKNLWKELSAQIYLGSEDVIKKWKQQSASDNAEIPRGQRLRRRPLEEILRQRNRTEEEQSYYEAHREEGYTQKEIASQLRCHYSTVSRRIKSHESKSAKCKT